jgi:hypothetical protein
LTARAQREKENKSKTTNESKNEYKDRRQKEYMDKKKKEHYGESQKEHMQGKQMLRRMKGFRRADENQESIGNRRVGPCHAHHKDRDQIKGHGFQNQDMRQRPHRHHGHGRRSTRTILLEKQHLERLIYTLQGRLRKVDRQLKKRIEHQMRQRDGLGIAYPHKETNRF